MMKKVIMSAEQTKSKERQKGWKAAEKMYKTNRALMEALKNK